MSNLEKQYIRNTSTLLGMIQLYNEDTFTTIEAARHAPKRSFIY